MGKSMNSYYEEHKEVKKIKKVLIDSRCSCCFKKFKAENKFIRRCKECKAVHAKWGRFAGGYCMGKRT